MLHENPAMLHGIPAMLHEIRPMLHGLFGLRVFEQVGISVSEPMFELK